MSITKNHQSPETLHAMARAAFPDKQTVRITELTEGLFNAAYWLDFNDGSASILKISAASEDGLLSNEINLMQAEIAAMSLVHAHGLPYTAHVQYSDFSRTLCSGCFFFMDVLSGRSLNSCQQELDSDTVAHVLRQTGRFQRQLTCITGTHFGLLGDTLRFDTLYEMMVYLFSNVLHDASARSISLPLPTDMLLPLLSADRAVFDEVTQPSLVHWDMWDGNIFVHNGALSGIIDWERAMWADPFMDDRFRRLQHRAFLEGYGQTSFTCTERRRIAWYDLFLYLTMFVESFYRQYQDPQSMLSWLTPLLAEAWETISRG